MLVVTASEVRQSRRKKCLCLCGEGFKIEANPHLAKAIRREEE